MMSTPTATATVLGGGSWGSVLAWLLSRNGVDVNLWARDGEAVSTLSHEHENSKYLPGTKLDNVRFTGDFSEAVNGASIIVSAVPCAASDEIAQRLCNGRESLSPDAILISGTKGLHPASGLRASQIWQSAGWQIERYVALSGPNLAREIAAGVPTSTVMASTNLEAAKSAQSLFASQLFRVYTNDDLIGVELGGALKNVVAIAAGICDGLGFGDNAKASLLTRGWHEMTRLAVAMGARERTLFGLSGMGDLFATCISTHSRNHKLGSLLGDGCDLAEAQKRIEQTAEGVHTTRAALELAKTIRVELPVAEQVAAILFEGRDPRAAVAQLMSRQEKDE